MRNRALVVAAAEPDNTTHIAVATSIGLTTTFFISGKQAGAVANRVLNGENIDAVRYATASSPKLTLNLGTARLIGLNVPKEVVDKAAQVYQ